MAVSSTNPIHGGLFTSCIDTLTSVLDDVARARAAAREFERLSGLSDARLAELGLSRGDIAAQVGKLYLST